MYEILRVPKSSGLKNAVSRKTGVALASALGVTRKAISKRLKALKKSDSDA